MGQEQGHEGSECFGCGGKVFLPIKIDFDRDVLEKALNGHRCAPDVLTEMRLCVDCFTPMRAMLTAFINIKLRARVDAVSKLMGAVDKLADAEGESS